jgi:hypothetical protein
MNKYPGSPQENNPELRDALDSNLEFPIDRDFLSLPPRLDPQVMLGRIAENLPWRSTRPGEQRRRLAEKVDVEFVL